MRRMPVRRTDKRRRKLSDSTGLPAAMHLAYIVRARMDITTDYGWVCARTAYAGKRYIAPVLISKRPIVKPAGPITTLSLFTTKSWPVNLLLHSRAAVGTKDRSGLVFCSLRILTEQASDRLRLVSEPSLAPDHLGPLMLTGSLSTSNTAVYSGKFLSLGLLTLALYANPRECGMLTNFGRLRRFNPIASGHSYGAQESLFDFLQI